MIALSQKDDTNLALQWSQPTRAPLKPNFPHLRFQAHAARMPDEPSVIFAGGQWTYGELDRMTNQLGHHLQRLGIGPDVIVAIYMPRCPEFLAATFGVYKAGGAGLLIQLDTPYQRLALMLKDTAPKVLLTMRAFENTIPPTNATVIFLDDLASVLANEPDDPPIAKVTPENVYTIFFTSGSTGTPKGVMLPFGWYEAIEPDKAVKTRHMLKTNPGTTFGRAEAMNPLMNGQQLFIAPDGLEKDMSRLIEFIGAHKITDLITTPTALMALLDIEDLTPCSTLQSVLCAGERISPQLKRRFQTRLDAEMKLVYGCTEGPGATSYSFGPTSDPDFPTVGRPIATMQIYILDEHRQPVPPGTPGEIYLGGHIALGYLNDPALTARRFVPHPFSEKEDARLFKTGDRGNWLEGGYLEVLGRMDDMVKIRGFRVELGDVETALSEHPALSQCVVIAQDETAGGKRLVAYFVPQADKTPSTSDLMADLRGRLPEYMLPAVFIPLDAMPMLANGKVDRQALPQPQQHRPSLQKQYIPPRTPLEEDLARLWSDVLEVEKVGIEDNFFDLGGHSLSAMRLFNKIQALVSRQLPLSLLVRAPTIAQLAPILDQGEGVSTSALVPIQPHGSRPPFFCVHGHLGNVLNFVDLARHMGPDQPFYGLQSIGLSKDQVPLTRIETMAARYIQEIQTVQPEGPYFLGGYCFGSLVALEMANQLQAQNHQVAFLGMIDVMPGLFRRLMPAQLVQGYKQYTSAYRYKRYWHQMKEMGISERISYLFTGFFRKVMILLHRKSYPLLKNHEQGLAIFFHNVESTNALAFKLYNPRPYARDIVLFQSEEIVETVSAGQALQDWSGLTTGKIDMHLVSDGGIPDVGKLFKEPWVRNLAQTLQSSLAKAQT